MELRGRAVAEDCTQGELARGGGVRQSLPAAAAHKHEEELARGATVGSHRQRRMLLSERMGVS
jgi:hypothetical protein